jgi:hypothetical protein
MRLTDTLTVYMLGPGKVQFEKGEVARYGADGAYVNVVLMGALGVLAAAAMTLSQDCGSAPKWLQEELAQITCVRGKLHGPDRAVQLMYETQSAHLTNRALDPIMTACIMRASLTKEDHADTPNANADSLGPAIRQIILKYNAKWGLKVKNHLTGKAEIRTRLLMSKISCPEAMWRRLVKAPDILSLYLTSPSLSISIPLSIFLCFALAPSPFFFSLF